MSDPVIRKVTLKLTTRQAKPVFTSEMALALSIRLGWSADHLMTTCDGAFRIQNLSKEDWDRYLDTLDGPLNLHIDIGGISFDLRLTRHSMTHSVEMQGRVHEVQFAGELVVTA